MAMRNPAVIAVCDRTSWAFAAIGAIAYVIAGLASSTFAWTFLAVAGGAVIGVFSIRRRFE